MFEELNVILSIIVSAQSSVMSSGLASIVISSMLIFDEKLIIPSISLASSSAGSWLGVPPPI